MLRAERLGYVALNVKDIEVSTDFFIKAVHLEMSARVTYGLNHICFQPLLH